MANARKVTAEAVDAFNAHDEGWMRSLYADRVVLEAPGEGRLEGADAAVDYMLRWLRAFPDASVTIDGEIADGDRVAHRLILEGTQTNTFVGRTDEIPATHRPLRLEAAALTQVKDRRITELQLFFDQSDVLIQLGLVPELASSA